MGAILWKDLRTMPRSSVIIIMLGYLAAFGILFGDVMEWYYPSLHIWTGLLYTVYVIGHSRDVMDKEKNKGYYYLRSLPIAPKKIVLAKFGSVLIILGGGFLINVLIYCLRELATSQGLLAKMLMTQLGVSELMLLLVGWNLSSIFRLGLYKGRLVAVGFLASVFAYLIYQGIYQKIAEGWISYFSENILWLSVLALSFFVGSIVYSIRAFEKPRVLERYWSGGAG